MIAERLFDEAAIAGRVRELGRAIASDYAGKNPMIVGVLTSSAVFMADLTRAVEIPCEYDFIALSRYADEGGIRFVKDTSASIEGRHVVLVEDTIDTGLTLQYIAKTLRARQPASLEVCTLLDRPHRRIAPVDVKYRGFEVPDVFVVGYGLDYNGRYRELPELYAHGSWPA
ncbi:MAG TPA: hypoxanthine phosphoribosyltransferase [Candidatus Baltobacteraceae bacterium]|nr:hypoxanthine phosphoribosyltransferase [Candidatus Baltobacteraceae bacterium]